MKALCVIIAAFFIMASCNNDNAGNDKETAQPDTTSSLPAPSTVDTNSLKTDSPSVKKALRK